MQFLLQLFAMRMYFFSISFELVYLRHVCSCWQKFSSSNTSRQTTIIPTDHGPKSTHIAHPTTGQVNELKYKVGSLFFLPLLPAKLMVGKIQIYSNKQAIPSLLLQLLIVQICIMKRKQAPAVTNENLKPNKRKQEAQLYTQRIRNIDPSDSAGGLPFSSENRATETTTGITFVNI